MSAAAITVPQANPGAGYRALRDEIDAAVARVLQSGWYILGQEVRAFEAEFAGWLGATAAVGCGNGTDALALALRMDCPIFVEEQVLKNSKVTTALAERTSNDQLKNWLEGLSDEDLGRYKM
jgi:dTDP-4-amino-4,6-dideoxygalactose transaminase